MALHTYVVRTSYNLYYSDIISSNKEPKSLLSIALKLYRIFNLFYFILYTFTVVHII